MFVYWFGRVFKCVLLLCCCVRLVGWLVDLGVGVWVLVFLW